jgi:NAD(P)H dehydrogenase (quinone)
MKTLIIYTHPKSQESHSSTILHEVKSILKEKNYEYDVVDLYEINYDPVLETDELYSASPCKTRKEEKEFQEKISQADKLIFIYPVWWGTMPAMLKGFIDRVFTSGFAFKYDDKGLPKGLLKGKEAIVILSTGVPKIASIITGSRFKSHIQKDILRTLHKC